jgi:DNA-binding XRE family transcriptional regulator
LGQYLDPLTFCQNWANIKRQMRQNSWNDPRIVFWQAVYAKLLPQYKNTGHPFRQRTKAPRFPLARSIGDQIKSIRKERGLTQREFSSQLRLSQQVLSAMEQGRVNLSLETMAKIARGLGREVNVEFIGPANNCVKTLTSP